MYVFLPIWFEGDFVEGNLKTKLCYCLRWSDALWSCHAEICFKNVSDIYLSFCGRLFPQNKPVMKSTTYLWWHPVVTDKPWLGSCLKCEVLPQAWRWLWNTCSQGMDPLSRGAKAEGKCWDWRQRADRATGELILHLTVQSREKNHISQLGRGLDY